MMKQQIYDTILATQSALDSSPGIFFETIIVNIDKAKALTKRNQL